MKKPIKSRYKTEAGYQKALNAWKKEQTAKKPAAKKPAAKKPVAKRKPFDPPKRGRGRPRKQQPTTEQAPKNKQTLKIKDGAQKTGKFLKNTAKQAYDLGKKGVNKVQTKLAAKDQTPQQANPEPKTKGQKLMSRLNKSYQNYKGEVLDKAGKDLGKKGKLRSGLGDKSLKGQSSSGTKASLAAGALNLATNALVNRAFKPKNMTMAEFKAAKEKSNREGVGKAGLRIRNLAGNLVNKVRGKGNNNQSSTSKNIKKQKEANNNSNKLRIKGKKTERSSRTNNNVNYNAKTRTRKVVTNEKGKQAMSSFRVDPEKNLQLQKEAKKGNKRTYTTVNAKNRKNLTNQHKKDDKKSGSSGKKMHAIEKRNRERFGDAHVERLKRQHEAFKRRRKKK